MENHFFLKWIHCLRPSYTPATCYVLTGHYLLAEEAQVFQEGLKCLDGRHNLTYLMDGWEDTQKHSIYGCMLAEVSQFPVVLGLEELTRVHATADQLIEVANHALVKKNVKPTSIIAMCTNNPTTMQAFQRKWTTGKSWILMSFKLFKILSKLKIIFVSRLLVLCMPLIPSLERLSPFHLQSRLFQKILGSLPFSTHLITGVVNLRQ